MKIFFKELILEFLNKNSSYTLPIECRSVSSPLETLSYLYGKNLTQID